jgi:hypothetical protein
LVNKGAGGLSSKVRVEEDRPDQWKRGISFRVLLHVDAVEDFTGAPVLDGGEPLTSFCPVSHTLPPCHLGTIDGRPVGESSGSILPAPIPALGELGPAFHQRHDDDDRLGRARSNARGDLDGPPRARPRESERSKSHRSLSNAADRRRSRSSETRDRRRSRSRHGSRCDDRELRKRHRREDDDDEERREPRRDFSRRYSSASFRVKSAGPHHEGGKGRSYGRSSDRSSAHYDGRRHHFTELRDAAPISLVGDAFTRKFIPSVVTCDVPCTDWTSAIKGLPSAFASGFSRLASPPPQAHSGPSLPSAWLEDVLDGSATPLPRLFLSLFRPSRSHPLWCQILGKMPLKTSLRRQRDRP